MYSIEILALVGFVVGIASYAPSSPLSTGFGLLLAAVWVELKDLEILFLLIVSHNIIIIIEGSVVVTSQRRRGGEFQPTGGEARRRSVEPQATKAYAERDLILL